MLIEIVLCVRVRSNYSKQKPLLDFHFICFIICLGCFEACSWASIASIADRIQLLITSLLLYRLSYM